MMIVLTKAFRILKILQMNLARVMQKEVENISEVHKINIFTYIYTYEYKNI